MNKLKSFSFLFLLVFSPIPTKALEPGTVVMIVEGVNMVTSALEKPQPNLTLEIVRHNREMLRGMNLKLDQLGDNLIQLHLAVGDIPEEVAIELDKERIYVLGVEATSKGQTLLDYIEEYEGELSRFSNDSDNIESVRLQYLNRLNLLETQLTNLGNEILQEDSIHNVDAVTLALITHSLLSTLTEISVRFDQREVRLASAARTYGEQLDIVLSEEPGTLSSWTHSRFSKLLQNANWQMLKDRYNFPSLTWDGQEYSQFELIYGKTFKKCIVRQSWKHTRKYRPAIVSAGEPEMNILETTMLSEDFFIRSIGFEGGIGRSLNITLGTEPSATDCRNLSSDTTTYSKVVEEVVQNYNRSLDLVGTDRYAYELENCIEYCGLEQERSAVNEVSDAIRSLEPSVQILSMVADLRSNVKAIIGGDYSGFRVSDTLDSLSIYRDSIREQVDEVDRLSRLREIEVMEEDRHRLSREVNDMIAEQDREIASLFNEAESAAKFNRTLGYIRLAAKIYQGWTSAMGNLTQGEDRAAINTIKATKAGLEDAALREPANAALISESLNLITKIGDLAEFYGSLDQARRAQNNFDKVITEAINSIPVGAVQSFDVYVANNDPFQFRFMVPAGDDVLLSPNESFLRRIRLEGRALGAGDRIDMHLDLREFHR